MGDDGYASVGLNFAFPFYDKTFNQAYMYDNGIISFIQPGQPNALSPWQWHAQPLSQNPSKYFIAGLWADIAPVSQTTYTVTQTQTTAKFAWNNIAEYYSVGGNLRLNNFSVELNANGDIAAKYTRINLSTSSISVGTKGDTDFTEQLYVPGGVVTGISDWTTNTKIEPPPDPVVYTPSVSDPVVAADPVVQAAQTTQTTQTTVTPVATSPVATSLVATAPIAAAPSQAKTESTKVDTATKKVAVKSVNQSGSVEQAVLELAVSIAATNSTQYSSQAVTQSVAPSNTPAVASQAPQDTKQSIVQVSTQTAASQITQDAKQSIVQVSTPAVVSQVTQVTTQSVVQAVTQTVTSHASQDVKQSTVQDAQNMASKPTQQKTAEEQTVAQQVNSGEKKDAVEILTMLAPVTFQQVAQERQTGSIRSSIPPTEFGPTPAGFVNYSSVSLPDALFYAPKQVYVGQKTVDNVRALRQLSSDSLHQRLIEIQYVR